jgi:hypothetical protein
MPHLFCVVRQLRPFSDKGSVLKSRFIRLLGVACGVVLSASAVSPAPAANINTNATECQATFWPQDDVVHTERGVSTASSLDTGRYITCTLLRSPLPSTATTGSFYVDGDNLNGASTFCVISSYDFTGVFLGSTSFTTSSASYDQFLTMPIAQLGFWAYTSLTCFLPAHGAGTLRGVTSLQ